MQRLRCSGRGPRLSPALPSRRFQVPHTHTHTLKPGALQYLQGSLQPDRTLTPPSPSPHIHTPLTPGRTADRCSPLVRISPRSMEGHPWWTQRGAHCEAGAPTLTTTPPPPPHSPGRTLHSPGSQSHTGEEKIRATAPTLPRKTRGNGIFHV